MTTSAPESHASAVAAHLRINDVRQEIAALRLEIRADMAGMEQRLHSATDDLRAELLEAINRNGS